MLLEQLSALPEPFTIFLTRHAEPDRARYAHIPYHIPPGPPLTDKGLQEAAELGEYLRAAGTATILSSPLERAWRTASIAAEACGVSPVLDYTLAEWRPEENDQGLQSRMQEAFSAGMKLAREKTAPVALVSHGAPILALLRWLGVPEGTIERYRIYDHRCLLPTAGAWRVEKISGKLHAQLAFVPEGVSIPTELII